MREPDISEEAVARLATEYARTYPKNKVAATLRALRARLTEVEGERDEARAKANEWHRAAIDSTHGAEKVEQFARESVKLQDSTWMRRATAAEERCRVLEAALRQYSCACTDYDDPDQGCHAGDPHEGCGWAARQALGAQP